MTPEDQNNSSEIQNNADSGCQTGPVRQGISPQSTPDDFFKLPMGFPSDDRTPTLPTSRRFLRNNCRQLRKETVRLICHFRNLILKQQLEQKYVNY